jgi:hypothetical protein
MDFQQSLDLTYIFSTIIFSTIQYYIILYYIEGISFWTVLIWNSRIIKCIDRK